jgi:hypothetical protein
VRRSEVFGFAQRAHPIHLHMGDERTLRKSVSNCFMTVLHCCESIAPRKTAIRIAFRTSSLCQGLNGNGVACCRMNPAAMGELCCWR